MTGHFGLTLAALAKKLPLQACDFVVKRLLSDDTNGNVMVVERPIAELSDVIVAPAVGDSGGASAAGVIRTRAH